jgi:hypothetical protein
MAGYVWPHLGYVRARSDMSSLGVGYVRSPETLCIEKVDRKPR